MIKPKKLQKGDTIAFLAPSSGLANLVPHRLEKGKEFFEAQGYKVKVYPTATKNNGFSSDTAENRAKDINQAFQDKEVKAIITTIGGFSCHQTFEYLDFEMIKQNPKIFMGYSDATSLHLALNTKCDLVTFYGPAVLTQFGDFPEPEPYTLEHFNQAVTGTLSEIKPSKKWTDDKTVNWMTKEDMTNKRKYKTNFGYEWLKEGKAKGKIFGGCISVLMRITGLEYWPDFTDKILLLETPEADEFDKGESVMNINAYLGDLRNLGTFSKIKGIVFGRGFGYTDDEIKELKETILENTRGFDFPILYGVDVGHSDPIITVPLGVEVELDSEKNMFKFLENGVE